MNTETGPFRWTSAWRSHPGRMREIQRGCLPRSAQAWTLVWAVADGMGGHSLGEPADWLASARDVIAELPPAMTGTDFTPLAVASPEELKSAFARLTGDTLAEASFRVQFK